MSSNPQRERLRDGAVLWVRPTPPKQQQERDRIFQKSLEEWREKHGVTGVAPDGSDVKRFMKELVSHLNASDTKELSQQEKEKRDVIEGEEHRKFSHMTYTYTEKEKLQTEEEMKRKRIEKEFTTSAERVYKSILLSLQREKKNSQIFIQEEKNRYEIIQEENKIFEKLHQNIKENLRLQKERDNSIIELNLKLKDEEEKKKEENNNNNNNVPIQQHSIGVNINLLNIIQPLIQDELRRLLEPIEKMCHEELIALKKQRDTGENFFSLILQKFKSNNELIPNEAKTPELSELFKFITPQEGKELKLSIEKQKKLLTDLVQEYRKIELKTSVNLYEVNVKETLAAVNLAQLKLCQYLNLLNDKESKSQELSINIKESVKLSNNTNNNTHQENLKLEVKLLEFFWRKRKFTKNVHYQMEFYKKGLNKIHMDVYNILIKFISKYNEIIKIEPNKNIKNIEIFLNDLLLQSGSIQSVADELCWSCSVITHPMRKYFIHELEIYAPYLCPIIDLILHLYIGREVEIILWIRPELINQGSFKSCIDENGSTYYYHTAVEISQWIRPPLLENE